MTKSTAVAYGEPESVRPSWKSTARVTGHQREALGDLKARSWSKAVEAHVRWVDERYTGSRQALDHLWRKGLVERREATGPRGGHWYEYRPLPQRRNVA